MERHGRESGNFHKISFGYERSCRPLRGFVPQLVNDQDTEHHCEVEEKDTNPSCAGKGPPDISWETC